MNHEILMMVTSGMPCRTIVVNGTDYLQRYYVGKAHRNNMGQRHNNIAIKAITANTNNAFFISISR